MHAFPTRGATDSVDSGILAMGEGVHASVPEGKPTHRIVRTDQGDRALVQ